MIGSPPGLASQWVPEDPTPDTTPPEFFDPTFMAEFTRFASFEEFCVESPWDIEDPHEIGEIPRMELDRYVQRTTQFDRWLAMRNRAAEREIRDRLLL